MNRNVKIAIAEPSLIIRSGIVSVLRRLPSLNLMAIEIADVGTLCDAVVRNKPDIVIANPAAPQMMQPADVRAATGCDSIRFVALLNTLNESRVMQAYDEAISIYDSADQISQKLKKLIDDEQDKFQQEQLSAREKDILIGVVKGWTNKQIAEKLFISVHTVITHRRNIAAKLQIHSTAGLTVYAIVNKLVELNEIKDSIYGEKDTNTA